MKKTDFIRIAILVIGLWSCFQAIIYVMSLLFMFILFVIQPGYDPKSYLTSNIIMASGYILMAWAALRRTDWVIEVLHLPQPVEAEDMLEKEATADASNGLKKSDVLYIVLIGVGLLLLIPAVPDFLEILFFGFKGKVSHLDFSQPTLEIFDFLIPFVKVALPLLVVLSAKKISYSLLK